MNNAEANLALEHYLKSRVSEIEEALPKTLPADWVFPNNLKESMMYSLMAGGKRLRPVFVLVACESLGGNVQSAMPVACAVEMIHTYSLVHDDLPAMDNDDYRRGKLTNHKVHGEAMAILAGDGLLTHAFYSVTQATRQYGVPADIMLTVAEELSYYSGVIGMVGGQAADMLGEQGVTSIQQLEYIHLHKTSDLIVFSLRAGARIGGANEQQIAALTEFGRKLGLAFQIQDDILDIIGDEALLGKQKGSDEKSGKVTYPYFIGLDASKAEVARLTQEAKSAVLEANLPYPDRLLELADYLMNRVY
ncbi:polyprenyl synthetase family protein [Paenibacillus taiwanensis]|uniref:polyprenyl synthetase family protein n=1 Tax=Paenibacillus taiwanensis TaxID=401638 RepID=UPI0004044AB3|nr:farnesyl diphosphate synthase [Paenibacillus taiwanensis]